MKRIACLWLSGAILAGLMVTLAAAQSQNDNLGEYARQKKKQKQNEPAPKKVYDNDNLPAEEKISVVGQAPVEPAKPAENPEVTAATAPQGAQQANDGGQAKPDAEGKTSIQVSPGESPEDRQKVFDEWQKKIADQKQTLALVQRELDVLQREYRLRAAAMYADVGNRLRNASDWDKEEKQYKDQIASKQKAVDGAKQLLADLQEQARKAGVPSKLRQ